MTDQPDNLADAFDARATLEALPTFAYEYRPKQKRILPLTSDLSFGMRGPGQAIDVDEFIQHVLHPDEHTRLHEIFSQGDRAKGVVGEVRESTLRVVDRDGSVREVRWRARCVEVDDDGMASRIVGVFVDESEQRRLSARVQNLEKLEAVGRLAAGVAHDFNNLLTAILGSAELAMMSLPPEATHAREYVADILAAAERGAQMTSSLFQVAAKPDRPRRPISVTRFLEQSRRLLERHVSPNHQLRIELSTDLWMNIDESQMFQVLQNLVVNGREAMADGGEVVIRVSSLPRPGGWWARIRVEDAGRGIPDADVPHIFDPFYTTKSKGSGLGLATVQSIVLGLEGHIDVHSNEAGTAFTILLPGFETAEEAQAALHAV
ncbi:MAG: ATP-binding protein [bacterium]